MAGLDARVAWVEKEAVKAEALGWRVEGEMGKDVGKSIGVGMLSYLTGDACGRGTTLGTIIYQLVPLCTVRVRKRRESTLDSSMHDHTRSFLRYSFIMFVINTANERAPASCMRVVWSWLVH